MVFFVKIVDITASLSGYSRRSGEEPGDVRRFGPMIARRGLLPKKQKGVRGFLGVRLIEEFEI